MHFVFVGAMKDIVVDEDIVPQERQLGMVCVSRGYVDCGTCEIPCISCF